MARAGNCPMCEKSRVLERVEIKIKGKEYFLYICDECIKKLSKNLVKPFSTSGFC